MHSFPTLFFIVMQYTAFLPPPSRTSQLDHPLVFQSKIFWRAAILYALDEDMRLNGMCEWQITVMKLWGGRKDTLEGSLGTEDGCRCGCIKDKH